MSTAACDATLFLAAHYFCRKHTHTHTHTSVWSGVGGTLERIVMCIGKFSNEFPKCDKDICIEFPIPQHANMCTHTERGRRVSLCVWVWGNISLALWVQKQSLLAGHIWSRSLPRFVGGSGESSANVCCSLFAHVIEVVSNRQTD